MFSVPALGPVLHSAQYRSAGIYGSSRWAMRLIVYGRWPGDGNRTRSFAWLIQATFGPRDSARVKWFTLKHYLLKWDLSMEAIYTKNESYEKPTLPISKIHISIINKIQRFAWLYGALTLGVVHGLFKICLWPVRPCGLMDKASDFGSEDCRFESCHGRLYLFLMVWNFHSYGW